MTGSTLLGLAVNWGDPDCAHTPKRGHGVYVTCTKCSATLGATQHTPLSLFSLDELASVLGKDRAMELWTEARAA